MSERKIRKCKNKGVIAKCGRSENLTTDDETSTTTPCCKSISKVKEDVKTVIELMGPNTPHVKNQSSSNLADNEESFFSNTTEYNQEKSKIEDNEITENYDTDRTVAPDMTLQEDTDYSIVAARHSVPEPPSNDVMAQCPKMICPPPWLQTNVLFGSECVCPQVANYMQNIPRCTLDGEAGQARRAHTDGNILSTLLKSFKDKCSNSKVNKKCEYYKMNMKQSNSSQGIPKRLVFDLVHDVREPCRECRCCDIRNNDCCNESCRKMSSKMIKEFSNTQIRKEDIRDIFPPTKMKSSKELYQKSSKTDSELITRVDVYYFDHGNADYLRTTDRPPKISTDKVAEKTEAYTTRFWAEIFGTCHIGVSFCTSFILQLIRFILYSLLRPLTIGFLQLLSDYFFKPFLTTVFNSFIQPPLTFLYNVATSIRDLCEPIAKAIGYFLKEISDVIRAFRIVEIFQVKRCSDGNCYTQRTCKA